MIDRQEGWGTGTCVMTIFMLQVLHHKDIFKENEKEKLESEGWGCGLVGLPGTGKALDLILRTALKKVKKINIK